MKRLERISRIFQICRDNFEIRHILCHEGGLTKPLDNKFIMQMISDSQLFVQYADF